MTHHDARSMPPATPEPVRDGTGAPMLGPHNVPVERENPSLLVPPPTDAGTVPNLKFPFAASHTRLLSGGWAREVTVRELPIATELAGVNMRLKPGAAREMHWHKEAEWGYVLAGRVQITAIDAQGRAFADDVGPGDVWNFPAGIPHAIQAFEDGSEFLLVFDDGGFSENETFLITDWFKHTPPDVLAKNFGVPRSAFARIPQDVEHDRYIFPAPMPSTAAVGADAAGPVYSHRLMDQEPVPAAGGWARIVDSSNFPAASTIAAALVEVEPGGMRELHWHPTTDEWQYYISGRARMTVFASSGKARTFDYEAGDVGYVPFAMGHYVENTGDEPLRFLELFRSDRFADISLTQWMAQTPPALVQAHLGLDDETMATLSKDKAVVVAGGRPHRLLDALPQWPSATIAVLSTIGAEPHAIPVTAPLRAGDRHILFALERHRGSLARLRERPDVALTILASGDEAFTARGRAHVVTEEVAGAPGFAAVALEADAIDDHRLPSEPVASGVDVRFAGARGAGVVDAHLQALGRIAAGDRGAPREA
jgi:oxalate decarboxylase